MTINTRELRKRIQLDGSQRTAQHLTEALAAGELKPEDFSIRDLAESILPAGSSFFEPRNGNTCSDTNKSISLLEDGETFLNITGAVIETKIREAYHQHCFAVSKLIKHIPTHFDSEKIYNGSLPDGAAVIQAGGSYTTVGIGNDFIETPATTKRGFIVPVTREAVFFDQTHWILDRAAEAGEALALNKEKRILDMILGITSSYKFNGTAYNTYYAGDENDPWNNLLADNELVDWTSIDNAENILGSMRDPSNDELLCCEPDTVLVMPQYRNVANRLFRASEINYSDTGNTSVSAAPNPFSRYNVISSRLAYSRLTAAQPTVVEPEKIWLIGNFQKAFAYMENWGITVTRSGAGSEGDFTNDYIVRYKASERGTPAVLNPRYVVKCKG
jgi:hypothetical protein